VLVTVNAAAKAPGCHPRTVRRRLDDGTLPAGARRRPHHDARRRAARLRRGLSRAGRNRVRDQVHLGVGVHELRAGDSTGCASSAGYPRRPPLRAMVPGVAVARSRRRPSRPKPTPRPSAEPARGVEARDAIGELIDRYLVTDPAPRCGSGSSS
jgi:hypothetical protein